MLALQREHGCRAFTGKYLSLYLTNDEMRDLKSILVIDEDFGLRYTLSIILRRAGYQITEAASTCEAFELLKTTHFDLIFLGIPPDQNGLPPVAEVRCIHPDIPIIVLTTQPSPAFIKKIGRDRASDYLVKPVDPPILLDRVQKMVSER